MSRLAKMIGFLVVVVGLNAGILAYLALHKNGATRGKIAGISWGNLPEDHARHLLSNQLYRLRQQLGDHAHHLHVRDDTCQNPPYWQLS